MNWNRLVPAFVLGVLVAVCAAADPPKPLVLDAHLPKLAAGFNLVADQAEQSVADRLKGIEDELKEHRKLLQFIADAAKAAVEEELVPSAKAPVANAALSSAVEVCRKCHSAKAADEKGGGFVMFDRAKPFTVSDLRDIVDHVNSDDPAKVMPPPRAGRLNAAQQKALTDNAREKIAAMRVPK